MSTTTAANLHPPLPQKRLLTPRGWLWLLVLGILFVGLFRHFFLRTLLIIADDPPSYRPSNLGSALANLLHGRFNADWSHGLVLPLIGAYFIHQNRDRLWQARPRLCWLGLLLLFQGMISFAWWMVGPAANNMFQGYSVIWTLFGLVLFLLGPEVMRVLWFPVLYLALAVPVSDEAWNAISLRLKMFASHASTVALNVLGLPFKLEATVDGAVITLFRGGKYLGGLNVADACSGLRMLMAFIALGAAVAFLSHRPNWQRWVLVVLTVPVAVAVNVGRVTVMGLLHLVNPKLAEGDFHIYVGMLMLVPALGVFLLLGWVLDKTLIPDEGDQGHGERRNEDLKVQPVPEPTTPRPAKIALLVAALVALNFLLLLGLFQTLRYASYLFHFLGQYQLPAYMGCWGLVLILTWIMAWRLDVLVPGLWGGMALPPVAGVSAPPANLWPLIARGALMGATITTLVGLSYALLLVSFRPEDFLHGSLHLGLVIPLLATSLLGLGIAAWMIMRAHYAGPARRARAAVAGRGLTAGVLLTAALGLTAVLYANGVVVFKQPIALRRELWEGVPQKVAGWEMVQEGQPLDQETLQSLGTTQYITRQYRRVPLAPGDTESLVTLHVTYYTGTVDTVPHVPWRCWVAQDITPSNLVDTTLELRGPQYEPAPRGGVWAALREAPGPGPRVYLPAGRFSATIFTFDPKPPDKRSNVVYFFVANGKFLKSPDMVRLAGFDPGDRYGYYAKIEVLMHGVDDQELARTQASAFLSALLPHVMACLPDWEALQQGSPSPITAGGTRATRVLSR